MHISILDAIVRAGGDSAGHDADLQYIRNIFEEKLSAVSVYFVDKDFDNPFENADEKGVAFAGMDLCFAFGFYRILPVFPLERFERHKVEIEAF